MLVLSREWMGIGEWSSMGRMTSHVSWKIKFMFETTNQKIVHEPE